MNGTRNWWRTIGLITLAVLCFTGVGAGWLLNHSHNGNGSSEQPRPQDNPVICFGYVDVKHGVRSLYPLQPGRVAEVLAEENQPVAAGAVLLRMDDSTAKLRAQEAQADLDAAQAQLKQARKLPQQHKAKREQLTAAIDSLSARLAAAEDVEAQKKELVTGKLLNPKELEIATEQVKDASGLLRAERQKLAELDAQDPALDIQRAEAAMAAQEARRQQAQQNLSECTLRAPEAGTVLRVLVGAGDVLSADARQPVLLFCPTGRRYIRAEVEQEYAGRVAVGQSARIEDDSDCDAVWTGNVVSVSDWYTQRRTVLREPLEFNDVRTLEVLIELAPHQTLVRIGQRMRVFIAPATGQQEAAPYRAVSR